MMKIISIFLFTFAMLLVVSCGEEKKSDPGYARGEALGQNVQRVGEAYDAFEDTECINKCNNEDIKRRERCDKEPEFQTRLRCWEWARDMFRRCKDRCKK